MKMFTEDEMKEALSVIDKLVSSILRNSSPISKDAFSNAIDFLSKHKELTDESKSRSCLPL